MDSAPLEEIKTLLVGMGTRFDGIDTRFDGIDTRLDGIDTRLDEQRRELQAFSTHITSRLINFEGRVEERFGHMSQQMRTMENGLLNEIRLQAMRTTRVEERLSRLEGAA